jgi:hypothetical protein
MADPQPTLPALTDSQELPKSTIDTQGDSENKASGPKNPSGAKQMSTSDSKVEEAGDLSRPTIPPESTGMYMVPHRF